MIRYTVLTLTKFYQKTYHFDRTCFPWVKNFSVNYKVGTQGGGGTLLIYIMNVHNSLVFYFFSPKREHRTNCVRKM